MRLTIKLDRQTYLMYIHQIKEHFNYFKRIEVTHTSARLTIKLERQTYVIYIPEIKENSNYFKKN